MKRRFFSALLAVTLLLLACLPSSLAAAVKYAGTWVCVGVGQEGGEIQTEMNGQSVSEVLKAELKEDGTMIVTSFGETSEGTWVETDNGITATVDDEPADFVLDDKGRLVATNEGATIILEKQKAKTGGLFSLLKGNPFLGNWVGSAMDEGDGELFTEIDGVKISDMLSMTINKDGTLVVYSQGEQNTASWVQEDKNAISADMWGDTVTMQIKDGQLVATGDGETIYFDRSDGVVTESMTPPLPTVSPAPTASPVTEPRAETTLEGVWEAVSYETMGYTFEAKMLFPDGMNIVFSGDGSAKAQITKDYIETLSWSEKDGAILLTGSYVLGDPKLNTETGNLTMTYGGSTVVVTFERTGDAPYDVMVPVITPPPVPAMDSQQAATALFSAAFPKEGWVSNESWKYDSQDYCAVKYEKQGSGGSVLASVTLTATGESVKNYRSKLKQLLEYAQKAGKDTLAKVQIGGIEFQGTAYENWGWKYQEFTARAEESRITLMITVDAPEAIGEDLQPILDSIRFTLPTLSTPNIDPPQPEDGVPCAPVPTTLPLGKAKVTAAWLPAGQSLVVDNTFGNQIAMGKGSLYVLTGSQIRDYTITDDRLMPGSVFPQGAITLGDKFEYLSAAKDGMLYASQGFYNVLAFADGAQVSDSSVTGDVAMHPDGEWGISFWASSDPMLVHARDGALTAEPWVLANLSDAQSRKGRFSSISCVSITQDRIYVAGNDAENGDTQRIAVYDLKGKELFTAGGTDWTANDGLSSVTGIVETKSGILVLDANNRALKLFDKKGGFLGTVDCDQLLGTNYAWPSCMIPAEDGGVLIAAAQTRPDESADELLIFHLTGI